MSHISYSELKDWAFCPFYHKLTRVDKIDGFKGNAYTAFGLELPLYDLVTPLPLVIIIVSGFTESVSFHIPYALICSTNLWHSEHSYPS